MMGTKALHFTKSCLKTLTAVEAELNRSNQHEFQGVAALRNIFGTTRTSLKATFSIRGDDRTCQVDLTWYDSREYNPNRSPEFRLYFKSNPVMDIAKENDSIVVGVDSSGRIYCELIPNNSPDFEFSQNWVALSQG